MNKATVGFAFTGSFCTLTTALKVLEETAKAGYDIVPIMSENVSSTDTRFGKASHFKDEMTRICGREPICCIAAAEPIGPKKLLDILVIAPCTGNSTAKIANGISDTCVTLAAKSHLRNQRPLLLGISSNDSLAANAKNIGLLLNGKNVFFVPMTQDDAEKKPCSMVADFSLIPASIEAALAGKQLRPIIK